MDVETDKEIVEYEPAHSPEILRQKITFLEEELLRKEQAIEKLKQENSLLFRTALKHSELKLASLNPDQKD